ncbi:MAG: acetone carboxylase subunit gamma, partial [Thermodesulfobacteriota bacterium]|nr:acetone carboxylase subunit gamma [Thermodesulfobacteriota bacterium]
LFITEDIKVKCKKCGYIFCDATENYKEYALKAEIDPSSIGSARSEDREFCVYREFYCPGCGVMLDVDSCPPTDPILWDTRLKL